MARQATARTWVIRDRAIAVLREYGFLTTAQITEYAGWILDSVPHQGQGGTVGFYHTIDSDWVKLLACDGERCLLSRSLLTGQEVLRHLNALERLGAVTKVKVAGVQAASWYLNNRDQLIDAEDLEALWNGPTARRNGA